MSTLPTLSLTKVSTFTWTARDGKQFVQHHLVNITPDRDYPSVDNALAVWLNGCADDESGSVDGVGHTFRVDNVVVLTDSAGFVTGFIHASIAHAEAAMVAQHHYQACVDAGLGV